MTESSAAVGGGTGTVTVRSGFGGTPNRTGNRKAKTDGEAVRTRYPSRPHTRLLCTDEE